MAAGKIFNDLWLYNINTNMWNEVTQSDLILSNPTPLPTRYGSFVKFSKGLILFGGSYWLVSDLITMNKITSNFSLSNSGNSTRQTYLTNGM